MMSLWHQGFVKKNRVCPVMVSIGKWNRNSQSLWCDTQNRQISQLETSSKFVFLHQVELHFTLRICNNYYSLCTLLRGKSVIPDPGLVLTQKGLELQDHHLYNLCQVLAWLPKNQAQIRKLSDPVHSGCHPNWGVRPGWRFHLVTHHLPYMATIWPEGQVTQSDGMGKAVWLVHLFQTPSVPLRWEMPKCNWMVKWSGQHVSPLMRTFVDSKPLPFTLT